MHKQKKVITLKILDCTLRDGGYYTKWDFDTDLVNHYLESLLHFPITYVELGYRSPSQKEYFGEFFYLPTSTLKKFIHYKDQLQFSIMLNLKDVSLTLLDQLLEPCRGIISLVRLAVNPFDIDDLHHIIQKIKDMEFKVAVNIMYFSTINLQTDKKILNFLINLKNIDYFYVVDSFGAMFPKDVAKTISYFKKHTSYQLGFHAHNNLELAFSNTLTAIEYGADIVDATITGMGRGAGNLKTEILLAYITKKTSKDTPLIHLSYLLEEFYKLQNEKKWGTSFPYIISANFNLHQGKVMNLISKNRYNIRQIVDFLSASKKTNNLKSIKNIKQFENYKNILILGGGPSLFKYKDDLNTFVKENNCLVIFSSTKSLQSNVCGKKNIHVISGIEFEKYKASLDTISIIPDLFILPPDTADIQPTALDKKLSYFRVPHNFNQKLNFESPLLISLIFANLLNKSTVYLAGFDGYKQHKNISNNNLSQENQKIINFFSKSKNLISLTPTGYYNLDVISLYSCLK
ncbi:hypothetical protein DID74_00820 [Candidatus Marinamargulisbacteria bacterium SCGC AG-333-B06]|nr:hypothetical protein DID74_00820 [Candidatus Marinamargulisbacteria bacterium SCGC AG-333-B06]